MTHSSTATHSRIQREAAGREAFRQMIRAWMNRSGWSLKVISDLCEAALRTTVASGVPDFSSERSYVAGELVVSHEYVWRAVRASLGGEAPQRPSEKQGQKSGEGLICGDWELVTSLRRLYPSQIHTLERGAAKQVGTGVFDSLGTLNLYLANVRGGRESPPADTRLADKVAQALVIEDADGPFGPEEMFSVYLGRLDPPTSLNRLTEQEAGEESRSLARRIRAGLMDAGLDLIDDWSQFVAVYPTTNPERLAKIRDVAQGRATWSAEQVEDEAAAVAIALAKLRQQHPSAEHPTEAAEGNS